MAEGKEKVKEKGKEKGKERVVDRHVEKTTWKKAGDLPHTTQWRKETPARGIFVPLTSSAPPGLEVAGHSLQSRTPRSTLLKVSRSNEVNYPAKPCIEGCSTSSKKVMWADAVRHALTHTALFHPEDPAPKTRRIDTSTPDVRRRANRGYGKTTPLFAPGIKKSYKEALLTPHPLRRATLAASFPSPSPHPLAVYPSEGGVLGAWVLITGVLLSRAHPVPEVLQDGTHCKILHGPVADEYIQSDACPILLPQRFRPADGRLLH
uniref:Uncharacterized protein n=1 Tax=Ananas comosus var. bracteatus TaxID=296719 RepID=A0A6V7NYQ7_ANACO|nr:unnamed protein product [Ananas comosus var. bracteatus]